MTRAEKVAEAQRLQAAGVPVPQIAERMGVKYKTAWTWLDDPDGSKGRARKRSYAGACVDCGGPTTGSDGPSNAPDRCARCYHAKRADDARARVIREIRRYAAMYGRPPTADDWNPQLAIRKCDPPHAKMIVERYERDGWPHLRSAQLAFGSWNAAIEAAGFTPRPHGARGPHWRDTEEAQAA